MQVAGRNGLDFSHHLSRNDGDFGEAMGQRPEIKSRSADEDREAPGLLQVAQQRRRRADIVSHREGNAGIDEAVEAMLRLRLFLHSRPRRQHAEPVVELHRIRVDDDTARRLRHGDGERRLAARGRTCDEQRVLPLRIPEQRFGERLRHVLRRDPHLEPGPAVRRRRARPRRKRSAGECRRAALAGERYRGRGALRKRRGGGARSRPACARRSEAVPSMSPSSPRPAGARSCCSRTWIPP